MTRRAYVLVLTRTRPAPRLSAGSLGRHTGELTDWVDALRRWGLLRAVAVPPPADGSDNSSEPSPDHSPDHSPDDRPVLGCLVVDASGSGAARRLARGWPSGCGSAVTVLTLAETSSGTPGGPHERR